MLRSVLCGLLVIATLHPAVAQMLRVPQDDPTIQAAIDQANAGDTIVVSAGRYFERIHLKPGISLRSDGRDVKGAEGLQRAEATVLDAGNQDDLPGVLMAEGCTLDGFTITNVGTYEDARWQRHFDSNGEELSDDEGTVQADRSTSAIRIEGVNCTVANCIVHHNGGVGIGVLGKEQTKTAALIVDNLVYRNMGSGIEVADGAEPIIRGNICKQNLRGGIGCRKSNPIIIANICFENIRAGIGCREGAKPVVRDNKCFRNRRAGIGVRMAGTAPTIEANDCYENEMAGIGCRDQASPVLIRNRCADNKLVAIGIVGGSSATIIDNELSRNGGMPPMIAIKDDSNAIIRDNRITGGGVAAILIQGRVTISGNMFTGIGESQGNAVWVWPSSTAIISDNAFDGYRAAVNATKATVTITGNTIKRFQGTAIIVKESPKPPHIQDNTATSADPKAKVVEIQGLPGILEANLLKKESLEK